MSGWDRDKTEKIDMNTLEQEIERLKAALKLAGGVCHEMKQPLMIISGHLELLSMRGSEDTQLIDKIGKINLQVQRLTELTAKLTNISQ